MKKIIFCLMALLCVMGVSAQSSRSISAIIPTNYQVSVNLSIDGNSFTVIPQKVTMQETNGQTKVLVYHNRGKADVTLPVSYDFTLEVVKTAWDLAYKWHYISEKEYQTGCQTYNRQKNNQ